MILVHVNVSPKMESIEKIQEMVKTVEGWKMAILAYDRFANTYHDKDAAEYQWIHAVEDLIVANVPEEYKIGVHLIAEQASFMGEDIYAWDGVPRTTLHAKHKECGKYKIVHRPCETYCAECNKYISSDDIRFYVAGEDVDDL